MCSHTKDWCDIGCKCDSATYHFSKVLGNDKQIVKNADDSARQIHCYIRLTNLIPELLTMMDEGKIALSVGVELSFLPEQFRYDVLEICEMNDCTPSYSQNWHLHQYYKDGALDKYLLPGAFFECAGRHFHKFDFERMKRYNDLQQ